ncbi:20634_t:CDS:2 [Entrophospora sp. SA101]|nr:20634_t:CDS:2 [Entrophospora sp. SA101]
MNKLNFEMLKLIKEQKSQIDFLAKGLKKIDNHLLRAELEIYILVTCLRIAAERIGEYNGFWNDVDNITKQAADFKQFYYYQKLLSEANITSSKPDIPTQVKKLIILGDYGFLQITPHFLKKEYLEKEINKHEHEDILREFSEKIKKIIEFIDFLPRRLNPTGKNQHLRREFLLTNIQG